MNPLTNMKNVTKLSELELKSNGKSSWHDMYKDSAWIFVGGLPYDLTEGDIISVFSQYGEIVNINLIRDKASGKSKGFCFICFEDQRSTVLTVDNLNGIKILGRFCRVDHVQEYKVPKDHDKLDEDTRKLYFEGCAPVAQLSPDRIKKEEDDLEDLPKRLILKKVKKEKKVKVKKEKKSKKHKKEKKKKRESSSEDSSSEDEERRKSKKSKKKKSKKSRHSSSSDSSEDSEEDSSSEQKSSRHKKSKKKSSDDRDEDDRKRRR
ncbi:RBMX2 family protein [Megaselia abdita]